MALVSRSSIAQVTAEAGYSVQIVDQNQDILTKSLANIKGSLTRIVKKKFEKDPKVLIIVTFEFNVDKFWPFIFAQMRFYTCQKGR
jgi:3-hydroxyacyl-CoA dehydrogenase